MGVKGERKLHWQHGLFCRKNYTDPIGKEGEDGVKCVQFNSFTSTIIIKIIEICAVVVCILRE